MNNLFAKRRERLNLLREIRMKKASTSDFTTDDFYQCPSCKEKMLKIDLKENKFVCKCGYHNKISAHYRLSLILDKGSFRELNSKVIGKNPLDFPEYDEKIDAQRQKTGLLEAVVTCTGRIDGQKAVVCVMDSRFMMGSMGVAVGEKITRAIEHATKFKLPLIIFSSSGGARMQEGILSLMQMAKTSAALARFASKGGFYISFLTHPTTGGVSASFASLGDITLAEPNALIGFAGPRVIEQTIGQKLPEGFQTAEYLEENGFVDKIIERKDMQKTLSLLLRLHQKKR